MTEPKPVTREQMRELINWDQAGGKPFTYPVDFEDAERQLRRHRAGLKAGATRRQARRAHLARTSDFRRYANSLTVQP